MTTDKAKTNASTKPATGDKATEQAPVKKLAIGSAENINPNADDDEALAQNAEANGQAGGTNSDGGSVGDDFQIRGFLMAIIIRLPKLMRIVSDSVKLDEMVLFVLGFTSYHERIVVVELIKAIGETNPAALASGSYKTEVQTALDVINGVAANRHAITDQDSQQSAFNRLQAVTSGLNFIPEAEAQIATEKAAADGDRSGLAGLYASVGQV